MACKAGKTTRALAEQYGINVKSVRMILREHGVKRRSRRYIQA
jgi:ribosomal protein L23